MTMVDLSRRFRELTKSESEDPESLLSMVDAGLLKGMAWADVTRHPRVILLAEAGSGKTLEMREQVKQLRAEGKPAVFLPLEALDEGQISDLLSLDEAASLEAWRHDDSSIAWLFLDAVDELKLTQGRLEYALRRVAKEIDGRQHRVRIVISSRPSDWRPSLDLVTFRSILPVPTPLTDRPTPETEFLSALERPRRRDQSQKEDPSPRTSDVLLVVLLPLDRRQIEVFARASGIGNVEAFLDEIRKQNAWSFARRPLDLAELVTTWKEQGRLGTRTEQHEANAVARLRDDPSRPDRGVVTDLKLRTGAERLALALSLTRKFTLRTPELSADPQTNSSVLDSTMVLQDWSEEERQTLLRRAIFDPATYGRVRFHHRSVQEYLAARRLKHLVEKGMSQKALNRLFFADSYGELVVIPSMRSVAAWLALWNPHVRRQLTKREPEILLSLGDPETLSIQARAELLKAFVTLYGSGGWRGLHIPIGEIRRLAHPELGQVVLELWGNGPTNEDVRELLLDVMEQGEMQQCAAVCEVAARDMNLSDRHRIMAVRVLLKCGQTNSVEAIARSIIDSPTSWSTAIVAFLVADLYPKMLSAQDVIRFIETASTRDVQFAFAQGLRRIAATIDPKSNNASLLRDLLADLIWRGRDESNSWAHLESRFDYVAPALTVLCHRQIQANISSVDQALIHSSAVASRFGREESGTREIANELRETFQEPGALRSRAFWIEFALMEPVDPRDGDGHRLAKTQHDGLVGEFRESDWPWLLEAAGRSANTQYRPVALRGLLMLWAKEGRPADKLSAMVDASSDEPGLAEVVRAWAAPSAPDAEIERLNRRSRRHQRLEEAREQQRLAKWKTWREKVLADPVGAFAKSNRAQTISNIYAWLNGRRDDSHFNVWDRKALITVFSVEIATRAQEALQEEWRTHEPIAWSAREPKDRNSTPYSWIYGLCGVYAESESSGWATRLSDDESRRAASYAPIEINGLPSWLGDLAAAQPAAVEAVLGGELEGELALTATEPYLPLLQAVASSNSDLRHLLAPRVLKTLQGWPQQALTDQVASSSTLHLDQALQILDELRDPAGRKRVTEICENGFRAASAGPLASTWLRGVFRFSPQRGLRVFETSLRDTPEAQRPVLATIGLSGLFGERSGGLGIDIDQLPDRGAFLGELVRIAFEYVRPAEDQEHEGVYTPNARDEAQRARGFLLSALIDTSGAEARRILSQLCSTPLLSGRADRLSLLMRERAAKDAEHEPFTPNQCVALDQRYEVPPNDRDGLFDLVIDRLDDLALDISDHDFTDRRTLMTIDDEVEMQRTLAYRLEGISRGAYTVTRESEVADSKRTDIRIAAVRGDQKATIEVKIADDRWSIRELESALHDQLVRRYLRPSTSRAGVLLLTFNGNKNYWLHPASHKQMAFEDVVEHLANLARETEQLENHSLRLSVYGLDLRGRDEKPKPS